MIQRKVTVCGTMNGYSAHLRRKEATCRLCKDANNIYRTKRRAENPELAISSAKWAKNHPEAKRASYAKWLSSNPGRNKECQARYRARNPNKTREAQRRSRARNEGRVWEVYTEDQVLELYGTNCYICGEPIDMSAPRKAGTEGWERGLHLDHVVPESKGGPDTIENVKPTHGLCNILKHDKLLELESMQ